MRKNAIRVSPAPKATASNVTQVAEVDFIIENLGTVVYFTPMTVEAQQLCEDGTIIFEDWQQRDGSIAVHHGCAVHLMENLQDAGFVIANK